MRKLIIVVLVLLVLLVSVVPVFAAPPCNDSDGDGSPSGREYAQHHIVPTTLGHDAHKPGSHQGFSLCLGVHNP